MEIDLGSIAAVLGAAGVGSVVGTLVAQSKDRRGQRAEVLNATMAVSELFGPSNARGATVTSVSDVGLASVLSRLRTGAVVSGLPRELVEQYEVAARAVAFLIGVEHQRHNDRILRGHLARLEHLVVAYSWQPWRSRFRYLGAVRKEMRSIAR